MFRLLLALSLLFLLAPLLIAPVSVVHAGQPQCSQHGPACHMQTCKSFDKQGHVTGSICNQDCAEKCCGCSTKCNRHHEAPDDEPPAG